MDVNIREKRKKVICDLVRDELYVPMKEKEMAVFLQVSREDREEFHHILEELLIEGKLMLTVKGKYVKSNHKVLTGTFISHPKGYGFVELEGEKEDLFVPEDRTGGAFYKDLVEVVLLDEASGKRKEAQVIRVLEHGIRDVVGTYDRSGETFGFMIPDNPKFPSDIFIPQKNPEGVVNGSKVVVRLLDYGSKNRKPEGKIIEVLGHKDDPGVDILSIIKGYDLPVEFSEKVKNQAVRIAREVSEADRAGRRDLRKVTMVTIDGEDAKDLDDAVSLSYEDGFYHLGVHIADVANYVQENSALDREALKRGTSVYLTDRVIPMLPRTLSNGICSLNAGEDRLALSCLMKLSDAGEVVDYELCESVIHVTKRMSYPVVKKLLEEEGAIDQEAYADCKELYPMFRRMEELAGKLRKRRQRRGAVNFDFPECKIYVDSNGHPLKIEPYERNVATDIIEEFMLAANETVAQHFYWMETPFVYRVHDVPDPDKIQKLAAFLQNFGYYMRTNGRGIGRTGAQEVHPKEIQKLLTGIEGTPEEGLISRLALRSMKKAVYSTECTGHFGLACQFYCHFTSPIRRYPDLQIHRIIKEQLRGRLTEERMTHYREILPGVCKQSSVTERRADEAERETDKLKKAEFMEDKIGQCFDGIISGIMSWGLFVELPDTVEGMVHVSKLPGDYFYYEESTYEMKGQATGKTYKLGMPVRVRVDGTDRFTRTVDFSIIE